MRDFADLARRALHESGYSISAAARALNYDLAYLSRVLDAKQKPSIRLATALDGLVGAEGPLAALVLNDDDESRLTRSLANPSRVDAGTVSSLTELLAAYRRLDDVVKPEAVIPGTLTQMRSVNKILKEARGPYRDRLAEVRANSSNSLGGCSLRSGRMHRLSDC